MCLKFYINKFFFLEEEKEANKKKTLWTGWLHNDHI